MKLDHIGNILFINGPPRCGKDTLASAFKSHYEGVSTVHLEKFAKPLKEGGSTALGIPLDELEEKWKAEVIPSLGVTWRQYQIDMSEHWYKPLYGQDIFGRLMVERLSRIPPTRYVVISDCGFNHEIDPVMAECRRGTCIGVAIHRPATTYEGDSREWLDERPGELRVIPLHNDGTPEELFQKLHFYQLHFRF